MVEGVIGLGISVLAALIYRDFRLAGEPSTLKRIVAFVLGFPWSVIVVGTVRFGSERLDASDDDNDLLEEIRRETRAPGGFPERDPCATGEGETGSDESASGPRPPPEI